MIELRNGYWAYPMPDAEGAEIRGEHPRRPYQLLSFYGEAEAAQLPPGTWEIVCTSKDIIAGNELGIIDANEFIDLLTSKGCDLKNNYLIIKKLI